MRASRPPDSPRARYAAALDAALRRLGEVPALRASQLVSGLRAVARQLEQPLAVAASGRVDVGRSTALAAALAGPVPTGAPPAPGCLTFVQFGATPAAEVLSAGNTRRVLDIAQWKAVLARPPEDRAELAGAERITLSLPSELLRDLVLVDTPGLDAPDRRDAEVTERVLASADALLWVLPVDASLEGYEVEALERHRKRFAGRAVCVLTGCEKAPEQAARDAAGRVLGAVKDYFAAVVPDAPEAVRKALGEALAAKRDAVKVVTATEVARTLLARQRTALDAERAQLGAARRHAAATEKRLDALVEAHLAALAAAWEKAAAALKRAQRELVSAVLGETREWVEQVPTQRRKPGFLADDYFIEWKRQSWWYWPVEGVEAADKTLREHASRPLTAFSDDCQAQIERLSDEYARALKELGEATSADAAALGLLAGQTTLFGRYAGQHWRKLNAYWWGGMKCGGARGLSAWGYAQRSAIRATPDEVEAQVGEWVPIARVLELGPKYLAEYRATLTEQHRSWMKLAAAVATPKVEEPPGVAEALAAVATLLG